MSKKITTTGEHLKQVREYIGLSQAEMAEEIGVSERQIRRWENWSPENEKKDPSNCRKFRRGDVLAYMKLLDDYDKKVEEGRI